MAIAHFFDKFQQQFSAYDFVGALYSPEMDFSKLKPYILNYQTKTGRNDAWAGIIFNRQTAQPGQLVYRSFPIYANWEDEEAPDRVETFKCANTSCEVNFNIVSNEIEHLEALENELRWFYNGWYEYTIDLNKLPEFKLAIGNITYGDLTKYKSAEYGQLCSLGMACTLNYPILLKNKDITVIKKIHYYLAKHMPETVFYHADIEYNPDGQPIITEIQDG